MLGAWTETAAAAARGDDVPPASLRGSGLWVPPHADVVAADMAAAASAAGMGRSLGINVAAGGARLPETPQLDPLFVETAASTGSKPPVVGKGAAASGSLRDRADSSVSSLNAGGIRPSASTTTTARPPTVDSSSLAGGPVLEAGSPGWPVLGGGRSADLCLLQIVAILVECTSAHPTAWRIQRMAHPTHGTPYAWHTQRKARLGRTA